MAIAPRKFPNARYNRWGYRIIKTTPLPPLDTATISAAAIARFWDRVDRRGESECWPWTPTPKNGYGRMTIKGRLWPAHRVAYFIANGQLNPALHVDHTCVNPHCVNPSHLRQVTVAVNIQSQVNHDRPLPRNVYLDKRSGRYRVYVKHSWRNHYGGDYGTVEEAEAAALALRQCLFSPEYEERSRNG